MAAQRDVFSNCAAFGMQTNPYYDHGDISRRSRESRAGREFDQ
jgi:hypothetical protein